MTASNELPKQGEGTKPVVKTTAEILATLHETQQVIASSPTGMGSGSN